MCAAKLWVNLQRRYKLRVRHRGHDPVTIHWSVMSTQVNTGVYCILLDRYITYNDLLMDTPRLQIDKKKMVELML